eukprot:TRINITY_DN10165_c0_g1_i1.p1 TRINITY_DN10165_c0_g1~~TRINITY_DN10165_c0_g1_i1.p1  ORF type:complete len:280 (-),score=72.30 TRINITY_DN10165_c0_g1_i1:70-909(-)
MSTKAEVKKVETKATTKPATTAPKKAKTPTKAMRQIRPRKITAVAPETFLKKRKRIADSKAKIAAAKPLIAKKKKSLRKAIFKKAESYVKEYRTKEKAEVRFRRQAKNVGNYYIPAEPTVVFVMRIRGIMNVSPKVKKILELLRLRQLNNGVFVKVNKATANMLLLVEPYVTYGQPNLKSIRELIYKRGYGKVNHQRIALTDNSIIQKVLGKYGVVCVEDIIHEIFTCGPHFREVNNFLWPFKLSSPLGGFSYKKIHFTQGGDHGNREEKINELIRKMN